MMTNMACDNYIDPPKRDTGSKYPVKRQDNAGFSDEDAPF
jgi:hypothetical protein